MGAFILDMGCTISCPHGGQAEVIPGNTQVNVGGNFALLVEDTMLISGCSFTVGNVPQPCLTIQWTAPAASVSVNGTPVLLQTSVGLCLNEDDLPQGTAIVSGVQTKVSGE
jgi:hypothetical protein